MPSRPPQQAIRVTVPPEVASGVYANYVDIKTSLHDHVLTFCHLLAPDQVTPGKDPQKAAEARAVCRVVIATTLLDPLVAALQQAKANREKLISLAVAEAEEPAG